MVEIKEGRMLKKSLSDRGESPLSIPFFEISELEQTNSSKLLHSDCGMHCLYFYRVWTLRRLLKSS